MLDLVHEVVEMGSGGCLGTAGGMVCGVGVEADVGAFPTVRPLTESGSDGGEMLAVETVAELVLLTGGIDGEAYPDVGMQIEALCPRTYGGGEQKICGLDKKRSISASFFAVRTGLEPVTPCVTGMYSNQLN